MALATCKAAAKLLQLPVAQVLPASTGVIGVELDAAQDHRRAAAAGRAASSRDGFDDVASAIMTTDLVPKTAFGEGQAAARHGAHRRHDQGLRHDPAADGDHAGLRDDRRAISRWRSCARMLKRGVERSYNRISVDGDTSTNDTLLLLANGASGVRPDPKEMAQVEEAHRRRDGVAGAGRSRATARARRSWSRSRSRAPPTTTARRASRAPSPIRRW